VSTTWVVILVAAAGTFAQRASFLVFADRLAEVSPRAQRVLRQIPPAVLAALVVPALVRPTGQLDLWQPRLLAGVVAGLVAWRSRNAGITLLAGMGVLVLVEHPPVITLGRSTKAGNLIASEALLAWKPAEIPAFPSV